MSDIKWIKITTDIFDDEKIRLIEMLPDADAILIIWFKLLAMAGKCNDSGIIYLARDVPYNDEMLSTLMRKPVNTIRLAIQEFVNLRMIEVVNDFIAIVNWEKHQNIQKLDIIKEQSRQSSQKYREKQKKMIECGDVTVIESDSTEKSRVDKNRIEYIYKSKYFNITNAKHNEYKDIYNFDLIKEYKKMKIWLDENPKRRKKDYPKFISNWLSRVVNTEEKSTNDKIKEAYPDMEL